MSDTQTQGPLVSVHLLIQSKESGLNRITNRGWTQDDSLAYRLAENALKNDGVTHAQILRVFEDRGHSRETIKGDNTVCVWRVCLKEGEDHVTRHWDCLAIDESEAVRLAEEANPDMKTDGAFPYPLPEAVL